MMTITRSAAAVLILGMLGPAPSGVPVAAASTDFGVPVNVASRANNSGGEFAPEIATDGNGVWISVWVTMDPALGVSAGQDYSIAFSRSTDDGSTWSAPQLVRSEFTGGFPAPALSIATDGDGKWIVVRTVSEWQASSTIQLSSSTDNGETWGAPVTLLSEPAGHLLARIGSDGAGTWLIVWESTDVTYSTRDYWIGILYSRSTDGGTTWSAPSRLSDDSGCYFCRPLGGPRLATDSNGTWGVVWEHEDELLFRRSTDNAATWEAPQSLVLDYVALNRRADIATDGNGHWILVWIYDGYGSVRLRIRRSLDDGATWGNVAGWPNHPFNSFPTPRIVSRGLEEWQIAGAGDGLVTMTSRDDGDTWSSPAVLVGQTRVDGAVHLDPAIAASPSRKTVVAWSFQDSAQLGIRVAVAEQDCPATPREDCRQPVEAGGSRILVNDTETGIDRLNWNWRYGQSTSNADLGDPTTSDGYAVCLYELSGSSPGLIGEWDADAGKSCSGQPCWTRKNGKLLYRDLELTQGSIRRIKFKSGVDGRAAIRLFVTGPALAPPLLPLDVTAPVRLQMVNLGTGACWEGIHGQADRNDELRFESTSE